MALQYHSDFDLPWCQSILSSPETTEIEILDKSTPAHPQISNAMFAQTLLTPTAVKAQITFSRPALSPESIRSKEYCFLLSVGPGVDGKRGRAHGGFNALVLDQILGTTASKASGSVAPATATMTVDYVRPIDTPQVVLVRAWVVDISGRKNWVKGQIEDGKGKVLARGKALFISARESKA